MIKPLIEKHGLKTIADRMTVSAGRRISIQRVNNWQDRGVPLDMTIFFCRAVAWDITPHQLHPDSYPHPEDGLPEERRTKPRIAASA